MPFIHLQLLYISSHRPAAQFVMSSHIVYSYTAQHNTTQYAHTSVYTNIQTECSAVGIATRYWLDHPAIKYRRGRRFPQPFRQPLGPTQPPLTLRRLMSYIYGASILDVSRSHTTTQHSR